MAKSEYIFFGVRNTKTGEFLKKNGKVHAVTSYIGAKRLAAETAKLNEALGVEVELENVEIVCDPDNPMCELASVWTDSSDTRAINCPYCLEWRKNGQSN